MITKGTALHNELAAVAKEVAGYMKFASTVQPKDVDLIEQIKKIDEEAWTELGVERQDGMIEMVKSVLGMPHDPLVREHVPGGFQSLVLGTAVATPNITQWLMLNNIVQNLRTSLFSAKRALEDVEIRK